MALTTRMTPPPDDAAPPLRGLREGEERGYQAGPGPLIAKVGLVDLEHAVLVEQLVVGAVLLEVVQRADDGVGQRLVGEGEAGGLREHAADGAGEVAALLHEHRRGVDAGRGVRLAGFQRLEGLGEVVEGHARVTGFRPFLGHDVVDLAGAPLLDAAQLDRDALAGEIVDRLQPERIALGGEEADGRLLVGHHVHQLRALLGPEDAGVDHVPALGGEARDHGGELGADVFRRQAEPLAAFVGELDPHAFQLALVVDILQRRQGRVDRHDERAGLDDVGRRDLGLGAQGAWREGEHRRGGAGLQQTATARAGDEFAHWSPLFGPVDLRPGTECNFDAGSALRRQLGAT